MYILKNEGGIHHSKDVEKMGGKDLKSKVVENLTISQDVKPTIVSATRLIPEGRLIIKHFPLSSSSDDIVQGAIEDIQKAGYKLEPKTVKLLIKGVEDIKDLGGGFKIGGNLSLEGGFGGSVEKSPGRQTEKHTEKQLEIWFEVKKADL